MTKIDAWREDVGHALWQHGATIDAAADFVESEGMTADQAVAYLRGLARAFRRGATAAIAGRPE